MADFHVSNLAVVNDEKLIGIVMEADLLNAPDESLPIGQLPGHSFQKWRFMPMPIS
jgi:CBS domain-containing protein